MGAAPERQGGGKSPQVTVSVIWPQVEAVRQRWRICQKVNQPPKQTGYLHVLSVPMQQTSFQQPYGSNRYGASTSNTVSSRAKLWLACSRAQKPEGFKASGDRQASTRLHLRPGRKNKIQENNNDNKTPGAL